MKVAILLSIVTLGAAYTHLDDTIDFKAMAENRPELLKFIECLLDQAPCNKSFAGYRQVTQEALEQQCNKCTDYQKFTLYTFFVGMEAQFPDKLEQFKQKYDPENVFSPKTLAEVSKYKDYSK